MKAANYGPVYCALYPQLAEISRKHGYAMAVHGTVGRDFDLICVPWVEKPSSPETVIKEITTTFAIRQIGEPDVTFHGRKRWTLSIAFGECAIDLQFMPCMTAKPVLYQSRMRPMWAEEGKQWTVWSDCSEEGYRDMMKLLQKDGIITHNDWQYEVRKLHAVTDHSAVQEAIEEVRETCDTPDSVNAADAA